MMIIMAQWAFYPDPFSLQFFLVFFFFFGFMAFVFYAFDHARNAMAASACSGSPTAAGRLPSVVLFAFMYCSLIVVKAVRLSPPADRPFACRPLLPPP